MKIIDLLNKMANGESVKFRVPEINYDEKTKRDDIFTLENGHLRNETCGKWIEFQIGIDDWEELSIGFLNKEVEVIEEDKKDNFTGMRVYQDGKEIYVIDNSGNFTCKDGVISDTLRGWFEDDEEDKKIEKLKLNYYQHNDVAYQFGNKINEIIDKINKGE